MSERVKDGSNVVNGVKITIAVSQMNTQMLGVVKRDLAKAYKEFNGKGKDVAKEMKRSMDLQFGPTWHVIGGRQFATCVTHETGAYCYCFVGNVALLIFKSA